MRVLTPETGRTERIILSVPKLILLTCFLPLFSDEGPETGEDSEDDLVRSYLPTDRKGNPTLLNYYY
jgi:hypothetical protein